MKKENTFTNGILNCEVRDADITAHAYFVKTDKNRSSQTRPAESDFSVLAELVRICAVIPVTYTQCFSPL